MSQERSVLDPYLPRYARDKGGQGGTPAVEFLTLRAAAERAQLAEFGERARQMQLVADRYGVTIRTLHRYLRGEVRTATVAGWSALFVVDGGPPKRVTAWQQAEG